MAENVRRLEGMVSRCWRVTIIITAGLLLSLSCVGSQRSPAPGCNSGLGCSPVMGGCFGKTVIKDFMVIGGKDCLDWQVNNCNGGVVAVKNGCDQVLVLGKTYLPPGDSMTIDLRWTADDRLEFFHNPTNVTNYIPDSDVFFSLSGTLGDQTLRIMYTKTGKLCE